MCEVVGSRASRSLSKITIIGVSLLSLFCLIPASFAEGLKVYKDSYIIELDANSLSASSQGSAARIQAQGLELRGESLRAKLVRKGRAQLSSYAVTEADETEEYDAAKVLDFCSKLEGLRYCEPNYVIQAEATPNDPSFSQLWGMKSAGGGLDAQSAWDLYTGSNQVVVAIIDTGVDYNHPDLSANMWRNPGEVAGNGIDDDQNGVIDDLYGYNAVANNGDPMDYNGHGTHVAGTIGAVGNNSAGVVGVNWNVKLMGARFLNANGSGSLFDAIKAIDYVTNQAKRGVKVVASNNSWGGGGYSQSLFDAIKRANDAGVIFVAAAGNSASDNDFSPHYPSTYDLPNVVSVAAVDSQGNLASFSNYGASTVDIAAPGVSIVSTYPGAKYASLSGTSMATPHVSGAIALLKGYDPSLNAASIITRLYESGSALPTLSSVVRTGRKINARRMLTGETAPVTPPVSAADYAYNLASVSYVPDSGAAKGKVRLKGDEGYVAYSLPFDFLFYGEVKSKVYLSTNGVIYFSKPSGMDFQNGSSAPKNSIAALHMDMVSDAVRVKPYSDKVVFYWNAKLYGAINSGNVEVWAELRKDGTILTSYSFGSAALAASAQAGAKGIRGNVAPHEDTYSAPISTGTTISYVPVGGDDLSLAFSQAPQSVIGDRDYVIDVSGDQGSSGSLHLLINGHECSFGSLAVSNSGVAELGLRMANRPFQGKIALLLRAGAFVRSVHNAGYKPDKKFLKRFRGRIKNSNSVKKVDVERMCRMLEKTVYQSH